MIQKHTTKKNTTGWLTFLKRPATPRDTTILLGFLIGWIMLLHALTFTTDYINDYYRHAKIEHHIRTALDIQAQDHLTATDKDLRIRVLRERAHAEVTKIRRHVWFRLCSPKTIDSLDLSQCDPI